MDDPKKLLEAFEPKDRPESTRDAINPNTNSMTAYIIACRPTVELPDRLP